MVTRSKMFKYTPSIMNLAEGHGVGACRAGRPQSSRPALGLKSLIDRIKDRDNDPFLGVLEKNKLLVVSMQIRFKTLTCKFESQLDGDVTWEPKIWIKIPVRVIQDLEVHEATSSRRG